MNHQDHVNLLRPAIPHPGGVWADLGSGEGAFTLALRELIRPEGEIWSVERDQGRLDVQRRDFLSRFPGSTPHYLHADLACPLALSPLDGIVMANSLHFFER